MNVRKEKWLIISLIKDDLINCKLVNGLNAIGLIADDYLLHLSHTIFRLLRIEDNLQNEILYEHYINLTKKVQYINIEDHNTLDKLALEIYNELLSKIRS